MYNPNYYNWAPEGWRCPMCGRVYSPTTPMCFYCSNKEGTIQTTGTSINDNEWWKEYLNRSQTGKPVNDNPSTTTASVTSNPNIKITSWNNTTTTCKQNCETCEKYEKSCFGGTETTSSKAIISHRKPLETNLDGYDSDILDSFIKHFQD